MCALKREHLFISLSWQSNFDDHLRLITLLSDKRTFDFPDYIDSNDHPVVYEGEDLSDEEIKDRLKEQLKSISCLLVMSKIEPEYEQWVRWEIECANRLGKPIIGIIPQDQKDISKLIRDNAGTIVGWNNDSIKREIDAVFEPPW